MSQTYTITEAHQGRTYNGKYGDMVVWKVRLANANAESADGMFELHKKPGNTPEPGDTLDVQRFDQGEHGGEPFVRIYLAKPAMANGSSSSTGASSGGGSKTYERQPDHPLNMARALHTSALSSTPTFINQLLAFGILEAPKDEAGYWALVGRVCGRLRASYPEQVRAQAEPQGAVQTAGSGAQAQAEIPADMQGLPGSGGLDDPTVQREIGVQPAAASTKADEDIPFARPSVPDLETRRRDLFTGDRAF